MLEDSLQRERILQQESNSGGFAKPIDWSLLQHRRHHPNLTIDVQDAAVLGPNRESRQRAIHKLYALQIASGHVVDVGCDQAALRELVPGKYTGIDLYGDADIRFDLCSGSPIPLADGVADFVACTDVLEHLNDPHFYCDELLRISRQWVLIALPNCWRDAWQSLRQGYPSYRNYGISPERHNDMHRWFFSTEEALDFVLYRAARAGFSAQTVTHFKLPFNHGFVWRRPRKLLEKVIGRIHYESMRAALTYMDTPNSREWLNRHVSASWYLLRRT